MSRADVLVSADWAEENLNTDGVVFVEVDEDTSAYDGGHIPGAVKLDWKTDLQDQVRRDFVSKEQFEELLSDKGIGNDDTVVLYGGNNNWFAAYAYWYFKLYGHDERQAARRRPQEVGARRPRAVARTPSRAPATTYTAKDQDTSIRAFRDEVIAAIGNKNLVDVRSPDEFSGKLLAPAHLPQEQSQRGGHIPTALNVPWRKAANEDGTFKSDDELRQAVRRRGPRRRQGHHRVLPHRRAVEPHLVRAARAARPPERQELRRFVDRVRLARRRADREGRLTCAAPRPRRRRCPAGVDLEKETVIYGVVSQGRRARCPARTSGCWTRPVSSPPRS